MYILADSGFDHPPTNDPYRTLLVLLALVPRHVLLHGRLPGESLGADGTHERLLVAVRPEVGLEVRPTRKGLVTLLALNLSTG